MNNKQVVTFMYKCRLCGKVYGSGCTGEANAFQTMIEITSDHEVSDYMVGTTPNKLNMHSCSAPYHGQGVSDLIGYRKGEH